MRGPPDRTGEAHTKPLGFVRTTRTFSVMFRINMDGLPEVFGLGNERQCWNVGIGLAS